MTPKRTTTHSSPPPGFGGEGTRSSFAFTSEETRAGLYIRVSTDQQANEGDSLEEQESELKKYCEFRKFKIQNIYIEKGKSGGTTKRPEYQKLIKDIQNQKINTVIVKKLDRLSRSLLDFESLMVLMQTHGVEFISIRESFDTTTAMGKAMLRIALVFAQLEREQTSERISDVMQYRASLGHYNGGQPTFGYLCLNKELIVSNQQKPIVELIYKKFLETHSINTVTNYLNDGKYPSHNQKPWIDSQISRILRTPTYKGMIVWKDQVYPGQHQPIIAPSMWQKVQDILESQKTPQYRSKSGLPLQKLAYCGTCQAALIPSFSYNKYKTKYWYYRCGSTQHGKHRRAHLGCTFKYVSAEILHTQVHGCLVKLTQENLSHLKEKTDRHNSEIETILQTLSQKIALADEHLKKLKAKKSEYTDILITKTFSAQDRYRIHERMNELETEEKQYQNSLSAHQLESAHHENQIISLDSLITILLIFQENTDIKSSEYKATLHQILNKIYAHKDKIVFEFKDLPWPVEAPLESG